MHAIRSFRLATLIAGLAPVLTLAETPEERVRCEFLIEVFASDCPDQSFDERM